MKSGAPDLDRAPAAPLSLRAQLVRLVLALLLPSIAVTVLLLWAIDREAYKTQERQLEATARTLSLVIDGRIAEQVSTVQALSVSPNLARADWSGFAAQARAALSETDSWVVVRSAEGEAWVNTHSGLSKHLPAAPTPKGVWSGQRGGAFVSNVIWGPSAKTPVIVVMKPVTLNDGRTVGLSVVQPATSFTALLKRQQLPSRWTASVLDANVRIVGRSRAAEKYVMGSTAPTMTNALRERPSGILRARTFEGIDVLTAYVQLPGYHWTAVVAMPREEAAGAARRAILVGMAVGLLLLTVGVLLALRTGARIAAPVENLARAAFDWIQGRGASFPPSTGLRETDELSRAFAAALRAVDERDEQHRLLMNELNHRVKNTLATVQAVAQHSRRGAASLDDYVYALEGRIIAMARAHELLTRSSWEGAEMRELAHEALEAFAGPRVRISGPPVRIAPTDALNLSLILYELATNAAKHGALSNDSGVVDLSWRPAGNHIEVVWTESGGPPVSPPRQRGFGSRLIARAAEDLQPSQLEYAPEGFRCHLTVGTREGA